MKKLIQLLNLYQEGRKSKFKFSSYDNNSSAFIIEKSPKMVLGEETIISKKFGFIKWLYDEQKIIDDNKIGEVNIIELEDKASSILTDYSLTSENVLMLLAIQDDPISFLISILK